MGLIHIKDDVIESVAGNEENGGWVRLVIARGFSHPYIPGVAGLRTFPLTSPCASEGRGGHVGLVVTSFYKGGVVNPQLRASREHLLSVRTLRARGIDQAALSALRHPKLHASILLLSNLRCGIMPTL